MLIVVATDMDSKLGELDIGEEGGGASGGAAGAGAGGGVEDDSGTPAPTPAEAKAEAAAAAPVVTRTVKAKFSTTRYVKRKENDR